MSANYANPEVLVSTDWVAANLGDTTIFVWSDQTKMLASLQHRPHPNAVHIDWVADLNDAVRRDYRRKIICRAHVKTRHQQRYNRCFLRRQRQLVGDLRILVFGSSAMLTAAL